MNAISPQPVYDGFVKYMTQEELQWNSKFVHLFMMIRGEPKYRAPSKEILRAMIVAAAQMSLVTAQDHGYSILSEEEQLELIQLFSDALLSVNNELTINQIFPS